MRELRLAVPGNIYFPNSTMSAGNQTQAQISGANLSNIETICHNVTASSLYPAPHYPGFEAFLGNISAVSAICGIRYLNLSSRYKCIRLGQIIFGQKSQTP